METTMENGQDDAPGNSKSEEPHFIATINSYRNARGGIHDFVGGEWKQELQQITRAEEMKKLRKSKARSRERGISR